MSSWFARPSYRSYTILVYTCWPIGVSISYCKIVKKCTKCIKFEELYACMRTRSKPMILHTIENPFSLKQSLCLLNVCYPRSLQGPLDPIQTYKYYPTKKDRNGVSSERTAGDLNLIWKNKNNIFALVLFLRSSLSWGSGILQVLEVDPALLSACPCRKFTSGQTRLDLPNHVG